VAGVIDHANASVTDAKMASGVGLSDGQIAKLPVATLDQALVRGGAVWGAGTAVGKVRARKNSQMPVTAVRPQINFVEGAAIGLSVADNPADDEIDLTISAKYPTQYIPLIPNDAVLPVALHPTRASVDGANFSYDVLDFDKDTEWSCFWDWFLTPDYLSENIEAYIYWISTGAGDVKFGVRTLGREKSEAWDAALGTEQTVVQTNAGAGLVNIAKINTFSPNWAPNDNVIFKLARKAADGADTLNADARVLKVVIKYTGQFSQSFYPLSATVDISPGAGLWQTVDVSAYVPKGATGVILHLRSGVSGLRKKGSTDARIDGFYVGAHTWAAVGIDANLQFECYGGGAGTLLLVGYTASGVVFFDNAYDKTPGATLAWIDINCSVECPNAIGIIVELTVPAADPNPYPQIRNNGSADDFAGATRYHEWQIIGCDGAQIFEGKIRDLTQKMYVVGYVTSGASFKVNATTKSVALANVWTTLDFSVEAPHGIMLFIQYYGTNGWEYGLRKKGDTENIYTKALYSAAFGMVPCDAYQRIEAESSHNGGDGYKFRLVGYATWGV
jgi:hypothetical protein